MCPLDEERVTEHVNPFAHLQDEVVDDTSSVASFKTAVPGDYGVPLVSDPPLSAKVEKLTTFTWSTLPKVAEPTKEDELMLVRGEWSVD